MREGRRFRGISTGGAALTLACILAAAGTAQVASQETPAPSPSEPGATASPEPTMSPSSSPVIACEFPNANAESSEIPRGGSVRVAISEFPPNVAVSLWFGSYYDLGSRPPIGAGTTDDQGAGIAVGVIPSDAPWGENYITVKASEECWAEAFIVVLLSPRAISVDDDTVRPGQLVTISAGGFAPNHPVSAFLGAGGVQEDCPGCIWLESGRTSARGSVVIRVRIPRDTPLGPQHLGVHGLAPDGIGDLYVVTDITVVAAGTLPPTDTAPGR